MTSTMTLDSSFHPADGTNHEYCSVCDCCELCGCCDCEETDRILEAEAAVVAAVQEEEAVDGELRSCDNDSCRGGRAWKTDKSVGLDSSKMFCSAKCADELVSNEAKKKKLKEKSEVLEDLEYLLSITAETAEVSPFRRAMWVAVAKLIAEEEAKDTLVEDALANEGKVWCEVGEHLVEKGDMWEDFADCKGCVSEKEYLESK